MKDIKVSVIVPVYKVPLEYLRDCLDSLKDQTLQECEFIVVSDGAPNAECSVCEEYATKDSRFKFFRKEHAGVSAARNFGIEQAQGEYISFVDSDDCVKQNYLSFLSQLQVSPDIIFFNFVFQFKNRIIQKPFPQTRFVAEKKTIQDNLLELFDFCNHDNFGYTFNKFFKKAIVDSKKIRFSENFSFMEDNIFTLQFCQHISNIFIANEELYYYHLSMNGLTFAKHNFDFYHNLSKELKKSAEYYSNPFKDIFLSKRIRLLHFLSFLSIVKQKYKINYHDFIVFRQTYLKERDARYSCLTLRLIFFFPPKIAYFFCYIYKMLCWLPGLKYPKLPKGNKIQY